MQWIEHGAAVRASSPTNSILRNTLRPEGFFIGMCFFTAFSYAILNKLNGSLFKNTLKQKSKVN